LSSKDPPNVTFGKALWQQVQGKSYGEVLTRKESQARWSIIGMLESSIKQQQPSPGASSNWIASLARGKQPKDLKINGLGWT